MPFGFNSRRKAENLSRIANQDPPSWTGRDVQEIVSRNWIVKTPSGGIPGRVGDTPGQAVCDVRYINARDPNNPGVALIADDNFGTLGQYELTVFNIFTTAILGNEEYVAVMVGGNPVVLAPASGADPRRWMRFKTTARMIQREVAAEVDLAAGSGLDPGDPVTIHDPNSLYPDTEPGAYGFAYYRDASARWEVETVAQPVNEIRFQFDECLIKTDGQITVTFNPSTAPPGWNRSDGPNNDIPPEWTDNGDGTYDILVQNPFKLDTVTDQFGVIRRVTDRAISEPDNLTTPKAGSATTQFWELVQVTDQIARFVCATSSNGTTFAFNGSFWDGANPFENCNPGSGKQPTFAVGCLTPCDVEDGSVFVCSYRPETNDYVPISSNSGVLGDPVTATLSVTPPTLGQCGTITSTVRDAKIFPCGSTQQNVEGQFPTTTQRVVDSFGATGSEICVTFQDIQVFDCGQQGPAGGYCADICELLCECPEFYSLPEVCEKPECNCDDCFISAIVGLVVNFAAGPGSPQTITQSAPSTPGASCSWTVPMSDGSTFTVTYLGSGNWEVNGVSTAGNTFNGTGAGDCNGAVGIVDGSNTANVGTTATPCDEAPAPVCDDCSQCTVGTTHRLVNLEWDGGTDVQGTNVRTAYRINPARPTWEVIGDCLWRIDIIWTADDNDTGAPISSLETLAQVTFDGTDWTITPQEPNPTTNESGIWKVAAAGQCAGSFSCNGFDCLTAENTMQQGTLQVAEDPCVTLTASAQVTQQSAPSQLLGDAFHNEARDLFKSCGCTRDVVALLNRSGADTKPETIDKIVGMLARKNRQQTPEQIRDRLTEAIEQWRKTI